MNNFESGPALKRHTDAALRYEDAATPATVEGWKCVLCQRFYFDEHAARYCCHTEAKCPDCDARKGRHEIRCANCYHKVKMADYEKMEQVELPDDAPSSACPLAALDSDAYFFDIDTLLDYCADHGNRPSEMFLVMCREHNPRAFSLAEWLDDYLPSEEKEMVGEPEEIRAIERAVDGFVNKYAPLSWYPDYKRRPSNNDLARLDAQQAGGD